MLPLAISVGAAVFPHDGDSYETLLATADSRMYRDKTRRKRRTGCADAEAPTDPAGAVRRRRQAIGDRHPLSNSRPTAPQTAPALDLWI